MEKNKIVKLVFKAHKMDMIVNLGEVFNTGLCYLDYFDSKGVVKEMYRTKGGFMCVFEMGSRLFIPTKRILYAIDE